MMNTTRTTNMLLLFLVVPLVFYLLKTLSFIFIPLVLAMFISLLFLPMMRWLKRKNVPRFISIGLVILIVGGLFKIIGELIHLTSKEILSADSHFFARAEGKLIHLITQIEGFFGIVRVQGDPVLGHYLKENDLLTNITGSLDFISNLLSGTLMTAFFTILLLSGSMNIEKLLSGTLFRGKIASVRAFRKIEKDIIKFVIVKFIISALTGAAFSLACVMFDVSFPIFWGLFAFAINFIQMIGSFIAVICLSLFAFVELEPTTKLLVFVLVLTGIQALFGGVLEPVFMGQTFSVNVITILVMLMFWGYIWGIIGLILSIPITVFIKIILEQFPRYKPITSLLIGKGQ